jgi:hypothetical protein
METQPNQCNWLRETSTHIDSLSDHSGWRLTAYRIVRNSLAYPIVVVGAVDLRHPSPARGRVSTVGQRVGYVRVNRLHQGCQLGASM